MTCIQVLGYNAAGILDGHFPAPEIYYGGAGLHMDVVELGAFEFAHEMILLLFYGSIRACSERKKGTKHPDRYFAPPF